MQASRAQAIQPGWLRLTHWLNAIAVVVLVLSGWRIYNASPVFSFHLPRSVSLGGWLGGALLWHFAAMWVLMINGLIYLALNIFSGRIGKRFFPIRVADVWHDLSAALRGKLSHAQLNDYNAVQKSAYLFVILDSVALILSGLVIWKSVQFPLLRALLGGYDNARVVHFVAMAALVVFIVVHLIMVALVPRSLLTMLRGR